MTVWLFWGIVAHLLCPCILLLSQQVKQAKKMKKEYEKKAKDKAIYEKTSKKKRREEAEAKGLAEGGEGAGAVRRTAQAKVKPFS